MQVLWMSSDRLTSKDEVDDSAPDVVGSVGGEDNEHRHKEGGVPQVDTAHDKDPGPTDAAAGRPCAHVQDALTPACPIEHYIVIKNYDKYCAGCLYACMPQLFTLLCWFLDTAGGLM